MFTSLALTVGLIAALAADEQPPAPIQNAPRHAANAAPAEEVPAGKYYAPGEQGPPQAGHYGANNDNGNFKVNSCSCTNFNYNGGQDYCGGNPYGGCCNPRGDCSGYAGYPPSHWTSAPGGGYSKASCNIDHRGCLHCDHCGPLLGCCNMSLHHAYYPQANGYYYFRPYNYTHICQLQHVITAWGGDRRHPYDTRFAFDKVYADMESEGLIAPDKSGEDVDLGPLGPMQGPPKADPLEAPPAPKRAGPGDLDNGSNSRGAGRSVVKVILERE